MRLSVEIDGQSGFCGGVIRAIGTAEKFLEGQGGKLFSLGAIVHNEEELGRLEAKGLVTVGKQDLAGLPEGSTVLVRAHGEPPQVYAEAKKLGLKLIDCTCPVVLKIQKSIREASGRILIFGKHGHPEVLGLVGQTDGAVVFEDLGQLEALLCDLDPGQEYDVFSQTTKDPVMYGKACDLLRSRLPRLNVHETICHQVASRHKLLAEFAEAHDVIVFVSGKESSNGKVLCELCRGHNARTYHIGSPDELSGAWFRDGDSVGVCGATSTPKWLLDKVAGAIENLQ